MNTLIHADIFFFVTTAVVIVIGILFAVAVVYLVRILNDLRHISDIVRSKTDVLAGDFDEVREKVKREGLFGGLPNFLARLFTKTRKRSNPHTHTHEKKH